MDETDERLLHLLRSNARATVAQLARRTGLARTTVQARVERLERAGVIAGYTIISGGSARARLRATVLISIEPRSGPGVLQRLTALPEVRAVHTTSGRFDLIATIEADTTERLDTVLDHIGDAKGVKGSESLIHLSTKIDRGT